MSDNGADGREVRAPRDVLLVLRIVHAAMLTTILAYGGIMATVARPASAEAPVGPQPIARVEPPEWLTPALAGLAAGTLLAILFVRTRMASQRETASASGDQQTRRRALARYYSGSIISWVLAESVAIDGLVLGIVHRDMARFLPFAGVSVLVMLLCAPRRAHMDELAPGQAS